MTFYHDFCCSVSFSSSLFYEGRKKGKTIIKVVVKSHAFLLDLFGMNCFSTFNKMHILLDYVCKNAKHL